MIMIAESGATKTDWALLGDASGNYRVFSTEGYSPYFIDTVGIISSMKEGLAGQFDFDAVSKVYFYGTGCSNDERKKIVADAMTTVFSRAATIEVAEDMMACAHALLGDQEGFAAILGTGSNTCISDGKNIRTLVDSLGYMLGDEGSGCAIGRKLVRDYLRNAMPEHLLDAFGNKFHHITREELLVILYEKPFPNRHLASYCSFTSDFAGEPYIHELIRESFDEFFRHLVCKYPDYRKYTFNCIGSVAQRFAHVLTEVAGKYGMKTGRILKSPLDDLVKYHYTKAFGKAH